MKRRNEDGSLLIEGVDYGEVFIGIDGCEYIGHGEPRKNLDDAIEYVKQVLKERESE